MAIIVIISCINCGIKGLNPIKTFFLLYTLPVALFIFSSVKTLNILRNEREKIIIKASQNDLIEAYRSRNKQPVLPKAKSKTKKK